MIKKEKRIEGMAKKPSLYKRLKDMGFDTKFSKKVSKRVNGLFDVIKLEELKEKYNDTKVAKTVFEGGTSKDWTGQERRRFIEGEKKDRKFFKGKFAGELTKEEKRILNEELKQGDLKKAINLSKQKVIDEGSRLEQFKQWIGKGKKPPKTLIKEIRRINKSMGASPNAKTGMFVVREMIVNGLTEEQAKRVIEERISPVNRDTVFYS